MKKQVSIFTLLMMLVIGVMTTQAQDGGTFKVWSPIDAVSTNYVATDDGESLAWEIRIEGTHGDACEFDLMTETNIFQNNIDIQVYRDVLIAATCLREDTPFETDVVFFVPLDEIPPYVIINDQVWEVILPDGDTLSTDDVPKLEELVLVGAVVEDVVATLVEPESEDDEPYYAFELSGSHGVGCDVPLVTSVRELAESTLIGLFNPVPELAVCPAMIIILDETIDIPATLIGEDALVSVNDFIINELETQAMSSNKVMTNINTVTVNVMESMPMQISLEVSGEHPDGCDYPVMIDQERDGDTVTLTIYRNVPADVMCPMMLNPYEATIPLDGTFESGSYTITVNGVSQSIDI